MLFETQLIGEVKTVTQLSVRNFSAIDLKSILCKVTGVCILYNLITTIALAGRGGGEGGGAPCTCYSPKISQFWQNLM